MTESSHPACARFIARNYSNKKRRKRRRKKKKDCQKSMKRGRANMQKGSRRERGTESGDRHGWGVSGPGCGGVTRRRGTFARPGAGCWWRQGRGGSPLGRGGRWGEGLGQVEREQLSSSDVLAHAEVKPAAEARYWPVASLAGSLATVCSQHTYETLEIWL